MPQELQHNSYGDVDVVLDGKPYVVRMGNFEFFKLQKAYGVDSIGACLNKGLFGTAAEQLIFYKEALARAHPDLTDVQVFNLMDYQPGGPEGSGQTLGKAVREALEFSVPNVFKPAGSEDPKATTSLPELKTF